MAARMGSVIYGAAWKQSRSLFPSYRVLPGTQPRTLPTISVAYGLSRGPARAFSLWSNNEAARKMVYERVEETKNMTNAVNDSARDVTNELHNFGTTMHERLAHANDSMTQVLANESESIRHASELATNDLKSLGLGGWTPSGILQHLLDSVQYLTDLPWWATIILVTCGIRLALAPLLVSVQGNSIRLSNIQPQMQTLLEDIQYAKNAGDQQGMQASALQVRKLLKENNCSPFKSLLLPVVQMPVFLSFYFALTGLANAPLPALATGGVAWFPDLTAADPYYALPILSSAMTLLVLETGAETGTTGMNQTPQAQFVKNGLRAVTVLAAWFISSFPSAVLLYWTTTNTFSLVQLLALRTRFMKRLLRLPEKIEHPVKPHVKQKSFMETVRSKAHENARPRAMPVSALRKTTPNTSSLSASRGRALDDLMSDSSSAPAASNATQEAMSAEKQARLAAARERRLRQRS